MRSAVPWRACVSRGGGRALFRGGGRALFRGGVREREVRFIGAEALARGGLTATVGEHYREVRNEKGADRRNGGYPVRAGREEGDCGAETHDADRHHDQVPAFPVGNVFRV